MRRFGVIFLGCFPAIVLSFFTGCASSRSYQSHSLEAPQGEIFLSAVPQEPDSGFFSRWSQPYDEADKIRYLLDRIGKCRYHFIRNGAVYDGRFARRWCLYKMFRWVRGVDTADGFVHRVASFSQKTRKPYLVELPDGRVYSMESVLTNELAHLEKLLTQTKVLKASSASQAAGSVLPAPAPAPAAAV